VLNAIANDLQTDADELTKCIFLCAMPWTYTNISTYAISHIFQ